MEDVVHYEQGLLQVQLPCGHMAIEHADSDVDLLDIMPASSQHAQAVRIQAVCPAPFPMDLLVRTPNNLSWRLAEADRKGVQ